MLEWLSGWLRSVILVILLATFVDLLLPNQSMQRYVKTVISLFLLLTLLQPLLALFAPKPQLEAKLTAALFQGGGGAPPLESLPVIRQRAEALRQSREAEARLVVERQVEELMKRRIEEASGSRVLSVEVETEADDQGQAFIRRVALNVEAAAAGGTNQTGRVKAGDAPAGRAAVGMEPVARVVPVAPVDVSVTGLGPESRAAAGGTPYTSGREDPLPGELLQMRTQILSLLQQEWELKEEQIDLQLKEGG